MRLPRFVVLIAAGLAAMPFASAAEPDAASAQHEFIEKKLLPGLTLEEKAELQKAEGMWPEYPQAVQRLALKKQLSIPDLPLPGPPEFWDRLRLATTDVPLPASAAGANGSATASDCMRRLRLNDQQG